MVSVWVGQNADGCAHLAVAPFAGDDEFGNVARCRWCRAFLFEIPDGDVDEFVAGVDRRLRQLGAWVGGTISGGNN